MSTVLVFNPATDLAGGQTADGEATLSWSAFTRILEYINGDAELGNADGWTHTVGFIQAVAYGQFGSVVPPQGNYIFTGTTSGSVSTKSYQRFSPLAYGLTIAQIDNDEAHIVVDWWGGTFVAVNPDQPALNIMFRDATLTLLGTHNSGFKNPSTLYPVPVPPGGTKRMRWDQYQEDVEVPVGTRFIDIELQGKRNQGTFDDSSWDEVRFSYPDGESLPFVPGYAIYQDGVLVATAPANASQYVITGLANGSYDFKVVAYDGTNFLSSDSNTVEVAIATDTDIDVVNDIFLFNDEVMLSGYLGGKLRGKTVACPGRNANSARKCGG